MEGTAKPRLQLLLTVAAIAVTVLSAVGMGALGGFLPVSRGGGADAPPAAAAAPAATPVPQPAKKDVARKPVQKRASAT
jgi:hypothetical protein